MYKFVCWSLCDAKEGLDWLYLITGTDLFWKNQNYLCLSNMLTWATIFSIILIVDSRSVVVGSVLWSVVRSGISCVSIWSIWMLLLMVDGHEVLHVHGVLPLLVGPDADCGQTEQDAGNESQSNSNPCNNVWPVILELWPGLQFLWPTHFEELGISWLRDFFLFPMFNSMPQSHSSSVKQTLIKW